MTFFMFGKAHAALPLLCGPIPSRFSSPLFCHHVVRQIAELRPSHLVGDRKRWSFGQYHTTASLSRLRTMLSESSSLPLHAKWPNHAT